MREFSEDGGSNGEGAATAKLHNDSPRKESKIIPIGSIPCKKRAMRRCTNRERRPSKAPLHRPADDSNMEKYHEEAYRCSRDDHADCRADLRSVRRRGAR